MYESQPTDIQHTAFAESVVCYTRRINQVAAGVFYTSLFESGIMPSPC